MIIQQRACDWCHDKIEETQPYIKVTIESDDPPDVAVGLPLNVQGDFCNAACLTTHLINRKQQ